MLASTNTPTKLFPNRSHATANIRLPACQQKLPTATLSGLQSFFHLLIEVCLTPLHGGLGYVPSQLVAEQ